MWTIGLGLLLVFAEASILPRITTATFGNLKRFVLEDDSGHPLSTPFYPRGSNYIRLNGSQGPSGPTLPVYHATFSPIYYNRTAVNASLNTMASMGYTYVRVFIDSGSPTRGDGINGPASNLQPLSDEYVANLLDFLDLASAVGIYSMITLENIPNNAYFRNIVGQVPAWAGFPQYNVMVKSYLDAWCEFGNQLATAIFQGQSSTASVFAYSLANEECVDASQPPFNIPGLIVTTADGQTYNMSDPASRQQCADANAVNWANHVAQCVRKADPFVMVTVGMFTFQAVNKAGPNGIQPGGDPRHPVRPSVLSQWTTLNFLDVHIYPTVGLNGTKWTLADDLATDEWPQVHFDRMPILMGETGVFKQFYSDSQGAVAMVQLQRDSCPYNFSGWAVWTWDTWEQGGFLWTMADESFRIAIALAPRHRPDACAGGDLQSEGNGDVRGGNGGGRGDRSPHGGVHGEYGIHVV